MMEGPLLLASGSLRLVLAPACGGSVARFDWTGGDAGIPILRGVDDPASPLDAACFPMAPFCNRIRGGAFRFRGREVRLTHNMPGDTSPIHGQGWLAPWRVEGSDDRNAALAYDHHSGEWPWDYQARQSFTLDERGLSVALSCRNLASDPMPCGLGLHPYFPCGDGTQLSAAVDHVWTVDEHVLPIERVPAVGRYSLEEGLACGRGLDNGYGGWEGQARIATPGDPFTLLLSSPDARFFQLYSPAAGGLFVAEPASHANDALSAPEADWLTLGMRVLEPGETMMVRMRLDVMPVAVPTK